MPNFPEIQVYIVDDEPSVCRAYARLIRSAKMAARVFSSVEDLLEAEFSDDNACIVSDVQMPGASGLELPALLDRAGHRLPVIFVTAHDTVEARDRAHQVGAAAYFRKPVDDLALLDAIARAVNSKPEAN